MNKTNEEINHHLESVINCTLSDIFEPISDDANKRSSVCYSNSDKPDGKTEAYLCIHFRPSDFIEAIQYAINLFPSNDWGGDWGGPRSTLKFIDVGCGVGQKVYMAARFFDDYVNAYGLELREQHVQASREILKNLFQKHNRRHPNTNFNADNIIQDNAITFNRYSEFDIIYFYCPSPDRDTEIELEKSIAKSAKVGAVVVGAMARYFCHHNPACQKELESLGWKFITYTTVCIWQRMSIPA